MMRVGAASHHKKQPQSDAGKVVIQMITTVQTDLKNEFQTAKKEEDEAQKDYEDLVKESTKMRDSRMRAMTQKEGAKATLEEEITKRKSRISGLSNELRE